LQYCLEDAIEKQYVLGAKLVRGAYMEKERERAQHWGYPSPIQTSKTATDAAYNAAITLCAEHVDSIEWMVASHNEESNLLAAQLIEDIHEDGAIAPNVYFSQLYGMSDHITFNLAKAGYTVSKYVPFGPIGDVIPYLMRRAQENSSVAGQTGRELSLLEKEVKRRKNNFSSI
jgi:proline dehydrogenase